MGAAMNSLQGPLYAIHIFFQEAFRQSDSLTYFCQSVKKNYFSPKIAIYIQQLFKYILKYSYISKNILQNLNFRYLRIKYSFILISVLF